MSQDCLNCKWIWTGNYRCVVCTEKIMKQKEREWIDKLFADFRLRGKERS